MTDASEVKKAVLGAPPKYSSVSDMQEAIEEYLNNPPLKSVSTKDGVIEVPVLTITGLCIAIGFESRQSFYDYGKKDKFSYTIKRAALFIENEYEVQLRTGNPTGAIFALKNFNWKDTQEIKQDSVVSHIMPVPTAASTEDWEKASKEVHAKNGI